MSRIWNVTINRKIVGGDLIEFSFPVGILPSHYFVSLEIRVRIKELKWIRDYSRIITSLLMEGWRVRVLTAVVVAGPPSATPTGRFVIAT